MRLRPPVPVTEILPSNADDPLAFSRWRVYVPEDVPYMADFFRSGDMTRKQTGKQCSDVKRVVFQFASGTQLITCLGSFRLTRSAWQANIITFVA